MPIINNPIGISSPRQLVDLQLKLQSLDEILSKAENSERVLPLDKNILIDMWNSEVCALKITAYISEEEVCLSLWRLSKYLDKEEESEGWVEFSSEWARCYIDINPISSFGNRIRKEMELLRQQGDLWARRRDSVELVLKKMLCDDAEECEHSSCPKMDDLE